MRYLLLAGIISTAACAADQATLERGRKEEARSCIPCHSLRIVDSQRLPRAAWDRELTKMAGWGGAIRDREALLEYLAVNFGVDKPAPAPVTSGDGRKKQ